MERILVVSQKQLVGNPVFKQDKNLLEVFDILKNGNDVKLLYLHKNFKEEKESGHVSDVRFNGIETFCLRDMMQNNSLKKNLTNFIVQNKIDSIIFMSYYMAQLVIPYIENIIGAVNVIVDFRLSNLEYVLEQYKDEKEKNYPEFHVIYKNFKMNFLQSAAILKNSDYVIFDQDADMALLEKEDIKNIISIKEINKISAKKETVKSAKKAALISVNRNNYSSKNPIKKQNDGIEEQYFVNESKYSNLIDDINNIIRNIKSDYFCIYNCKLKILPDTIALMADYMSFNKNLAAASPLTVYSREQIRLNSRFSEQRNNNFSNWEENSPLLFSECFVAKKIFFTKIGYLDNRFKTLDYALFDFILRLYQCKAYYCVMNDVPVFKSMAIERQISLFKNDKTYLCGKWGELNFNLGI